MCVTSYPGGVVEVVRFDGTSTRLRHGSGLFCYLVSVRLLK